MPSGDKGNGKDSQVVSEAAGAIEAWRKSRTIGEKHDGPTLLVYDCSSMHHAPPTSKSKSPLATNHTLQTVNPIPREEVQPETKQDDLRDIPPLSQNEVRDEDDLDAIKLRQYSKESNFFLLVLGGFALMNTMFLTRVAAVIQQQQAVRQAKVMIMAVPEIQAMMERQFNTSFAPITLKQPAEEVWVPMLWFVSLMLAVMGTLLVLVIKRWLMGCSIMLFTPPPLSELNVNGNSSPGQRQEAMKQAYARRMVAYRVARKEALEKTARLRRSVPVIACCALAIFILGLCGKLLTIVTAPWLQT